MHNFIFYKRNNQTVFSLPSRLIYISSPEEPSNKTEQLANGIEEADLGSQRSIIETVRTFLNSDIFLLKNEKPEDVLINPRIF